jgi:very-short-patch-repair endonuclease
MTLNDYLSIVNQRYQAGNATEHSYRGDLQQLLQSLLPDVDVTNEPKRIDCGAPDYILSRKDIPIAYIEAKDVGVELGAKIHKAQFDRYKAALDNLIITDYLQFHFYKQGQLVASCHIGEVSNGKVFANPQNFDAFTKLIQSYALVITQSIKSPVKLAQMMAAKAKLMADVIHKALDEDDANQSQSELKNQYEAFKTVLIHDISNAAFADIYAQTIAYGMFAARYHDPTLQNFSREEAARLIPQSNPFLRQLFRTVAGYNLDDSDGKRLLWIVEELVQIFLATDVASIMQNFGRATRQQDPVVHFYETFLAEYDPKLRKARGVWYTPEPVVNFIVRAVDDILKTKFKLPQGLGDTSKTQITVEVQGAGKKGKTEKLTKEIHKVQILDPATGTGTFLAQVVRHIYGKQFANMQGAWPQYVKEHLIPRLNGFELLMTSYAMAHLKLDMLLTETGAYAATPTTPSLRATPSTTPSELRSSTPSKEGELSTEFIPLQNEGVASRSDDGVVAGGKKLAKVFHHSLYGKREAKYDALNAGGFKTLPWQQIDYKAPEYLFIQKEAEVEQVYIQGFSINDLFLLSSSGIKTHRDHFVVDIDKEALQQRIQRFYDLSISDDEIRNEMDLKNNRDWNLNIARKNTKFDASLIKIVTYRPFDNQYIYYDGNLIDFGRQNVMRHMLTGENLGLVAVVQSQAANLDYFDCIYVSNKITDVNMFRRGGPTLFALYTYPDSTDLLAETTRKPNLNMQIVGAIADSLGLVFTAEKATTPSLRATPSFRRGIEANGFNSPFLEGVDERSSDGVVKTGNKLNDLPYNPALKEKARELRKAGNLSEVLFWNAVKNKQLNSLDFDRQRVIGNYIVDFYCHECALVVEIDGSSHDDKQEYDATRDTFLKGLGLNVLHVQDVEVKKNLSGVIELVKQNITIPSLRATSTTPSELRSSTPSKKGELSAEFIPLQNEGVARSDGVVAFAPIDLLDYIYAVLHNPTYRETYKEFLKIDFPRVPYPKDAARFWQLVALGGELRQTHLLEDCPATRMNIGSQSVAINYPIGGSNVVDKPSFTPYLPPAGEGNMVGKVYINATQYFENVPELAWSFYIGGYQPAQKWLKDRKGRALTHDDIAHYQKIIAALANTHRLMQAIDGVFSV